MEIFTTGYPRSGSTWLNRLLSDLYSSPMQTKPDEVIEYAGIKQDGNHVIRKTHWRVDEYSDEGYDGNCKIVFIQRDPRDVAVSAMYYCQIEPDLMSVLKSMIDPSFEPLGYHKSGYYERWLREWLDSDKCDVVTKYESLHHDPVGELSYISNRLTGYTPSIKWIEQVIQRQSFEKWIDKHPHSMRKGIVGDWKNHFAQPEGEYITEYLGKFMLEQGYIDNLDWWKELE